LKALLNAGTAGVLACWYPFKSLRFFHGSKTIYGSGDLGSQVLRQILRGLDKSEGLSWLPAGEDACGPSIK